MLEDAGNLNKPYKKDKCGGFIKDLDSYALKIIVERRKTEMQLEKAIGELKKAKSNEDDAKVALRVLQGASALSWIWPPARIAATAAIVAAEAVLKFMKALEGFTEKIKEAPNDSNAINEAFDNLERELEIATGNLSQKIDPVLERNENYAQKALEYREFLESRKEGFIVDEKNPYPEEVRFNEWRLAEFDSVFSAIVPLEDLNKTACAHHALKALQAALKDNDLGFDAAELEQIAKGFIPRGYLWHFDANVLGNLALVREELLLGVKHTKGYSLWTEFLQKQN
ncbi:hypothetical protein hp2018_0068 [Helicobacter pylori 2018]|nr:hypothetical protein hp2017_0065 [Helicobacter pylori 2017]ADZ50741.1 hypothetical protein hp2018_0068 [Helicobacter pylori 2018]